ncbi:MAG: COX15/CtaA family protein [Rhizobiales bacterium]|jgi:cytochrome c oxidase assembly protein subunit 15|nr:COX15/CtaA family protein [Hyphomicrobiales bacterium]MBP9174307.1 COX15/CtaA family protein [Hyphomicrobiales bacterium]
MVRLWLYAMAFLVFCMVIVGGATRLTDSGLSITEWRPLLGVIPPMNEADWLAAFEKYKLIPEYQIQNRGMPLSEFKFIYWWEWAHRFLGRFIGLAFALPLIFFTFTRRIDRALWPRLFALFILGGAQGALGWYMVASGLVDRVDVSQYRLAAHLTLAALIFAAIIWVAMGIGRKRKHASSSSDWFAVLLVAFVLLQIAAGGFVAGLDAGQGYVTWPKMDGQWIPSGLWEMAPGWKNAFENAMTVQFNHRILAYMLLLATALHAWQSRTLSAILLAFAMLAQACLGILTLLLHVPLAAALIHQAGAMIVLALALWNTHVRLVIRSPDPNLR